MGGHPLRRVTHSTPSRASQQPSHPSLHPTPRTSINTSGRMRSGWRQGVEAVAAPRRMTASVDHPEVNRPTGFHRNQDRYQNRPHPPARSNHFYRARMTAAATPTTTVTMRRMTGFPGRVTTQPPTHPGHPPPGCLPRMSPHTHPVISAGPTPQTPPPARRARPSHRWRTLTKVHTPR